MKPIKSIEGIGISYADTLKQAGVTSVESLLDAAADRRSRDQLATKTGISSKLILKWANMADLFRIRGVAGQYAELLECAGVDTVRELAQRNAASLQKTMTSINQEKRVVRKIPSRRMVEGWIQAAQELPRKITH